MQKQEDIDDFINRNIKENSKVIFDITRLSRRRMSNILTGIDRLENSFLRRLVNINSIEINFIYLRKKKIRYIRNRFFLYLVIDLINKDSCKSKFVKIVIKTLILLFFPGKPKLNLKINFFLKKILFKIGGLGSFLIESIPKKEKFIYINTSHIGLLETTVGRDLLKQENISSLVYIHDLFALNKDGLEYEENSKFNLFFQNLKSLKNKTIIVNSIITASSVSRNISIKKNDLIIIEPPLDHLKDIKISRNKYKYNYFVSPGTISKRKNSLFLLNVWLEIIGLRGKRSPHLIFATSKGNKLKKLICLIDKNDLLKEFVHIELSLSDQKMFSLQFNSLGLIMPSHQEGYGYSYKESEALGLDIISYENEMTSYLSYPGLITINNLSASNWAKVILNCLDSKTLQKG